MIASPGRATGLVAIDPVAIDRSWLDAVRRAVLEWYRREGRSFPFRGTTDPYLVLVSETILQQTQVSRGGPAWQAFTARFPTVESLAADNVKRVIKLPSEEVSPYLIAAFMEMKTVWHPIGV